MKRLAPLVLAAPLFVSSLALAQSPLEADAVAFRLDSTQAEVELYYGVLQRALSFKQNGNAWEAPISARAEIWQNGKVVASQDIERPVRYECSKPALDSLGANKLLGGAAFTVPYAQNTLAAFIWKEAGPKHASDTIVSRVNLVDADVQHFALGGLELASSMERSTGASNPFERVGYIVTPNPSGIYGENYTKLYYYTELYVPKSQVDPTQTVEITSRVVDPNGKQILSTTQKQNLTGSVLPVLAAMDIDGLPTDAYKVQVIVKHEDGIVAQAEKAFYYASDVKFSEEPSAAPAASEEVLFAASPFSKLTDEEADDQITQALYVGTDADRNTAHGLKSVADKQHFLYSFWRAKDAAHPTAQPLSAYADYQQRIDEVNKKYSYQKTIGWKTDQGKIYLIFGPPQYVHEELFNPETKPYIEWDYDPSPNIRLTSGSQPQFIFLDRQGGGRFVLIHSNVLGQTNNPNWYNNDVHRLTH